jgi:hypothetical protein
MALGDQTGQDDVALPLVATLPQIQRLTNILMAYCFYGL